MLVVLHELPQPAQSTLSLWQAWKVWNILGRQILLIILICTCRRWWLLLDMFGMLEQLDGLVEAAGMLDMLWGAPVLVFSFLDIRSTLKS